MKRSNQVNLIKFYKYFINYINKLYYKGYIVLYFYFRDINIKYISMLKWLLRTFVKSF